MHFLTPHPLTSSMLLHLMLHDYFSGEPEIMTDLYRAPLPTTGGYLSHTTHRSMLCSDVPDHG